MKNCWFALEVDSSQREVDSDRGIYSMLVDWRKVLLKVANSFPWVGMTPPDRSWEESCANENLYTSKSFKIQRGYNSELNQPFKSSMYANREANASASIANIRRGNTSQQKIMSVQSLFQTWNVWLYILSRSHGFPVACGYPFASTSTCKTHRRLSTTNVEGMKALLRVPTVESLMLDFVKCSKGRPRWT